MNRIKLFGLIGLVMLCLVVGVVAWGVWDIIKDPRPIGEVFLSLSWASGWAIIILGLFALALGLGTITVAGIVLFRKVADILEDVIWWFGVDFSKKKSTSRKAMVNGIIIVGAMLLISGMGSVIIKLLLQSDPPTPQPASFSVMATYDLTEISMKGDINLPCPSSYEREETGQGWTCRGADETAARAWLADLNVDPPDPNSRSRYTWGLGRGTTTIQAVAQR